jgi:hypothetical protein
MWSVPARDGLRRGGRTPFRPRRALLPYILQGVRERNLVHMPVLAKTYTA